MADSCGFCGKELTQTPGRRKKEFCNTTCRSNHWNEVKRKEKLVKPKTGLQETIESAERLEKAHLADVIEVLGREPESPKKMPNGLSLGDQIQWKIDNP